MVFSKNIIQWGKGSLSKNGVEKTRHQHDTGFGNDFLELTDNKRKKIK
jgi:hypothetical protein